jgi:uncharacterized OsmC-like protein
MAVPIKKLIKNNKMETSETNVNGFDLEAMENTMSALKTDPKIAEFKFRAVNKWKTGVQNRSYIQGFYGANKEDASRTTPFEFDTDMPEVLNGLNGAPSPPEFLLHSMASCMTTSMMMLASANGIEVEAVTMSLEGDLNLNGFLGLDSCILKEYEHIRVSINVEGDLTNQEKDQLVQLAQKSPMYSTILKPIAIDISINN